MTYKISSFVAVILCLCLGPWAFAQSAEETFGQMSLKERVGQVFIWTYSGTTLTPLAQAYLQKYQPGALIAFSRNIQNINQIAKLNQDTQKFAAKKLKAPFFLMVDQEGGTVTRLRTGVPLPSALALGKVGDAKFIQSFAKSTAEVLHDVGFSVNLAPVLDISNPEKDSFIGSRAFGDDPTTVAEFTSAYAEGTNEGGLIPTAKHFPGHGGVLQDSHQTMPRKMATYEELADKDLVPFEEYAQSEFPRALMMAHLALPAIDPSGVPATYSSVLIGEYLRGKLKYDGLVITDDLEMSGASIDKDIGERAIRAFLAGNDMLMSAGSAAHQKRAFEAIYSATKSGRISESRLKESVMRILKYKYEMKVGSFAFDGKHASTHIAALENLSREVLKRNFHMSMQGKTALWPDLKENATVLVLSSEKRFYDSFASLYHGKNRYFRLTPQSLSQVEHELDNVALAVFYASGTQTARWLTHLSLAARAKVIVINVNHSGEVAAQDSFLSVLNINSHNPDCGAELAETLNSTRAPANSP